MEDVRTRLKAALIESLGQPEEVQTDSGRVKNQSVAQIIRALEYLEKTEARGPLAKRCGFYKIRNKD